jgi:hypothetical protein
MNVLIIGGDNVSKIRKLAIVCSKKSVNFIYEEYVKIMNITDYVDCYASSTCKMKE